MGQLIMYHLMDEYRPYPTPANFKIRNFRAGEEAIWVDINKCGIFGENTGMEGWDRMIVGMKTIVPERDILFATMGDDDTPVATLTAFVRTDGLGDIHMVTARECARGHGIGQALLSVGMEKLFAVRPELKITRLSTDDWRLPAIVGYLRAGFHPVNVSEDMQERWQKICDTLHMHGIEMVDADGKKNGIVF